MNDKIIKHIQHESKETFTQEVTEHKGSESFPIAKGMLKSIQPRKRR
jgi:hypothetical protein